MTCQTKVQMTICLYEGLNRIMVCGKFYDLVRQLPKRRVDCRVYCVAGTTEISRLSCVGFSSTIYSYELTLDTYQHSE